MTVRLQTAQRHRTRSTDWPLRNCIQRAVSRKRRAIGRHTRRSGAVLPIVLLISAMMLTTSAVWFETSLAAARGATNVLDYLQAFHAADSALTLCARSVVADADENSGPWHQGASSEPSRWRAEATFEASAIKPVAQWPGSVSAPQCLIEAWRLSARAGAQGYLLTARGFGRTKDSQVWLQMQLVIEGGKAERHWRRVSARPF